MRAAPAYPERVHIVSLADRLGRPVVALVRGLLDPGAQDALRAACFALEPKFVDASIDGAREDWRLGSVVYDPPPEGLAVAARVREVAPEIAARLGVALPGLADVECQLALYGDGGFYKLHTDSRGPDVERRVLSYVHYVVRAPGSFEGGALRVVATDGASLEVVPEDGMTALFPSELEHEVRPVRVPSGAFADGRFAITGWVWRP